MSEAAEQSAQAEYGAAASGAQPLPPLVHQCWEQALDHNSQQYYWFNRATGVSQWHPPPSWAAAAAAAATAELRASAAAPGNPPATAAPAVQNEAAAAAGEAGGAQLPQQQEQQQEEDYEPGLYYRDAAGLLQGPFSLEQLQGWRGMLPMDLPVLQLQMCSSSSIGKGTDGANGDGVAKGSSESGIGGNEGGKRASEQEAPAAAARGELQWTQQELAALLGDEELLERWRMENPEQASGGCADS
jgi:hypothetical protein